MNKLKRSFLEISNITLMPELRHVHVLGADYTVKKYRLNSILLYMYLV